MDEAIKLFGTMMAIMIPVGIGGGVFVLIAALAKRTTVASPPLSSQELEELRLRVDGLEQGQRHLDLLAERVTFVERMLPALHEGKRLSNAP